MKRLYSVVSGFVIILGMPGAYALDLTDAPPCLSGEHFIDLYWGNICVLEQNVVPESNRTFINEDQDWLFVPYEKPTERPTEKPISLEEGAGRWWLLFLGRGYVINGGNIASRFFPLLREQGGIHIWAGTQALMNLLYITSMYAKFSEKVEAGDRNVVNGIQGKAHIDLGKMAGFYIDSILGILEYVRALRIERVATVVAESAEGVVPVAEDPIAEALSELLVRGGWLAHLTGTSMNVASLTSKFYAVQDLENKGNATEAELARAWKDVYVYIVKLSGGVVGLSAKLAYATMGYDSYYARKSAMLLSVLGSGLFLYWDMGGLF